MLQEIVTIEVVNWSKYQCRKDTKKYSSWFRLDHGIIDDPKFFGFSSDEFKAWIYLLCMASRQNQGVVQVNVQHLVQVSRVPSPAFFSSMAKLQQLHIIKMRTSRGRYADVTQTSPTVQNSTEQNKTETEQDRTEQKDNTSCMGELALAPSGAGAVAERKPKRSKWDEATRAKMKAFLAAYSNAYKARYNAPPEGIRDAAILGKLGAWIANVSEERAVQLAECYLQINHRWFDDSCHDLWQFFRHLNRIGNALTTGADAGSINWAKVFGGEAA